MLMPSGFLLGQFDFVLPYNAELSFTPATGGTGVPRGGLAMIGLSGKYTWVIPRDGKDYFLKGTLEIPL
jgi:hypothetical protein